MIRASSVVVLGAWIALGCASDSHGGQVRDARLEQAEERADARESNVEDRADAREERTADSYDRREDRNERTNAPGEDATEDLNELSEERAEFQNEAREELEKHAVHIQKAQQKIAALGTRAPTSLENELKTARTEHDLAKQELSTLQKTPSSQWENHKNRIEKQLDGLESRLSQLDDHIEDQ